MKRYLLVPLGILAILVLTGAACSRQPASEKTATAPSPEEETITPPVSQTAPTQAPAANLPSTSSTQTPSAASPTAPPQTTTPATPTTPVPEVAKPTVPTEASVTIGKDGKFSPASVTLKKGGKLTFKNEDAKKHQVMSNPHPAHTDNKTLNIGVIAAGKSAAVTLDKTGEFGFHDHLNPSVTGKVTVSD